jgi:hypothetical protein
MKKFLIRFTVFLFPLFLYCGFIILMDPYNYFHILRVVGNRKKFELFHRDPQMSMLGTMIWKLSEYNRSRCENIILADSRGNGIYSDSLKRITGKDYYNFSTPGADCGTIINLFWYACERAELKNVYIAVSFHNYGVSWRRDLYAEASEILKNGYPFFINQSLVRQAAKVAEFAGKRRKISWPYTEKTGTQLPPYKESFGNRSPDQQNAWDAKVNEQTTTFSLYKYPGDYFLGLKTIAVYCRRHRINLVFMIFPNYKEVGDLAIKANLKNEMERFKKDIRSLGETYDFDYPNEITGNKDLYYDIVHFNWVVYSMLYREIWKHDKGIAIHTFPL